uniref:TPX2 C-terminal domain-containing protein n=1 Tax=Romanomermis culicivorax TaxID=13658 RepID=A0A915HYE7_ROMCU
MKKNRIIEDPIVTAEIRAEEQKENILKEKNADEAVAKLCQRHQKQIILEEQRKQKMAEPTPVTIIPLPTEPKRRGRPPKVPKESCFEFENQMEVSPRKFI